MRRTIEVALTEIMILSDSFIVNEYLFLQKVKKKNKNKNTPQI